MFQKCWHIASSSYSLDFETSRNYYTKHLSDKGIPIYKTDNFIEENDSLVSTFKIT